VLDVLLNCCWCRSSVERFSVVPSSKSIGFPAHFLKSRRLGAYLGFELMVSKGDTMGGHAKVAFLGLGAMGLGMATSLLRAGFTVQGYDVSSTLPACLLCVLHLYNREVGT